jgi:hypothetical protein
MFKASRLIHWIAAASILMSAIAPAVSQAVSVAQNGQGFAMEVCSADGSKTEIAVLDGVQTESAESNPCPYCQAQASFNLVFENQLRFQDPQRFAFFPALFYQSPKPLAVWVMPPSAAPPASA